jgi:DHA1 family multidrug resistance protein-like MFS transporter
MMPHISHSNQAPRSAIRIVWLLAVSLGLLMTGYAVTMPVFGRHLVDSGSGVGDLSMLAAAYALGGIVAAPFMGMLADRIGRRPLVLGSLLSFVLTNLAYLLADSIGMLVAISVLEGALSAGLFPAALGIVADIASPDNRSRWVGYVTGGATVGWVLGPLVGGLLYDAWGFAAPFLLSAGLGLLAFAGAALMVPETRPRASRRGPASLEQTADQELSKAESLRATLPHSPTAFGMLLLISFVMYFAWTFFEPQLLFYVFGDLGWTTSQFGLASGGYGLASVLGQIALGRTGDRFGRKPTILIGLLLFAVQFGGLIVTDYLGVALLSFVIGGLGEGLVTPALTAFLMDISEERHKARVMGMNSSAASLGGAVGPLMATLVAARVAPQSAFTATLVVVLVGTLLALIVLREPRRSVCGLSSGSLTPCGDHER